MRRLRSLVIVSFLVCYSLFLVGCGRDSDYYIQQSDTYVKQRAYDAALGQLQLAGQASPSASEKGRIAQRLRRVKRLVVDEAESRARDARAKGDLAQAITLLTSAKSYGQPSTITLLAQCERERGAQLLRQARAARSRGDHTQALDLLQQSSALGNSEARGLKPRYEQAYQRQQRAMAEAQAREERAQRKRDARTYQGDGSVQIAVAGVELHRSTQYHTANRNSTFVYVCVSARNQGDDITHVNPNDFTLADSHGNTAPYDSDTYSLGNPFNAVDLRPGQSTTGWLVFCMLKDKEYTLGYQGYGGTASKDVMP